MIFIAHPDSLAVGFLIDKGANSAIQGITLDQIMFENQRDLEDIMKLDPEGAEKEASNEKYEWLNKMKLTIIELHDRYKPDSTKTFFRALEPHNYNAYYQHKNIFIHL